MEVMNITQLSSCMFIISCKMHSTFCLYFHASTCTNRASCIALTARIPNKNHVTHSSHFLGQKSKVQLDSLISHKKKERIRKYFKLPKRHTYSIQLREWKVPVIIAGLQGVLTHFERFLDDTSLSTEQ
jgi:hypothetical protein